MSYRFRLLAGRHRDSNGRRYNAGDELESNKRLDLSFRGRFELLNPTGVAAHHDVDKKNTKNSNSDDDILDVSAEFTELNSVKVLRSQSQKTYTVVYSAFIDGDVVQGEETFTNKKDVRVFLTTLEDASQ